jgi:hypothetical protein
MLRLGSRLGSLTNQLSVANKAAFSSTASKLSEYPPNGFSFGNKKIQPGLIFQI